MGAAVALASGGFTRGFRNNNPGNLKAGTPWKGVIAVDPKGFAIFDTMENGVRALGKDLSAKMARGVDTVRKILYIYAPPSDNNPTASYVDRVADWMQVDPDQPLSLAHLPNLVAGIIRFENGKPLAANVIAAGLRAMNA